MLSTSVKRVSGNTCNVSRSGGSGFEMQQSNSKSSGGGGSSSGGGSGSGSAAAAAAVAVAAAVQWQWKQQHSGGYGSSGGRSGSGSAARRRQRQRSGGSASAAEAVAAQRRQRQCISGNSANDFFSDQGSVSNFFSVYYGSDSDFIAVLLVFFTMIFSNNNMVKMGGPNSRQYKPPWPLEPQPFRPLFDCCVVVDWDQAA